MISSKKLQIFLGKTTQQVITDFWHSIANIIHSRDQSQHEGLSSVFSEFLA